MKSWKESAEEVRRVRPDKEMAASLLKMMEMRLKAIESLDAEKFPPLVIEGYYEVMKEAITALMAVDGYKTLSHEALVAYLNEHYHEFSDSEMHLIDQLRQLRNSIIYKGLFVGADYIERNGDIISGIIEKLKSAIKRKLR
ncbi:MAG: hypothetical protein HZB68_03465 [Candidatus Aenigmarchaeota archaeon]|nr:hypothetical protein [Candidatus Aenigmarchaeota archaeon]